MRYRVTEAEDGWKLLRVLRDSMGLSGSAVQGAKWEARILLDGESAHTNVRVRAGQEVTFVEKEKAPVYVTAPYALQVPVVYRDEHLLIVDKPAPLASQSSRNHPDNTLENALFSMLGCPEGWIYRPVNRLDKGTSGLMAVACSAHAQYRLQQALHTPDFRRVYLAVTRGLPPEESGVIDLPIAKAPGATVRRVIAPSGEGKPSVTHYEVLESRGGLALLRLELETGRTHQIRVHLAALGCPVFGDFLYGEESDRLPGRFALHSHQLSLTHPVTGERLSFVSPLPEALRDLLR